jgi:hypothetical protein
MTDTKATKAKKQNKIRSKNVLEAINEIGSGVVNTTLNETKAISDDFFKQLLGQQAIKNEKHSTDLTSGSTLEMKRFMSGEEEKNKKLQEQIFFERRLHIEEKQETDGKLQELRVRLHAVSQEAMKLAQSTASLSQEVKVAILQNPVNASEYQVKFFEDIIKLIANFRKKIDSAVVWMQGISKRAEKKNYWNQYKKKGASFLLSPDHYSQRSAG